MSKNNRASFWLAFLGVVLTVSGLTVTAAVFLYASAGHESNVLAFCRVALIVGPILIGQAVIARQHVTLDEAYEFGRDIGEESGYKKGRRAQRPVVVDLKYSAEDDVQVRRHPE